MGQEILNESLSAVMDGEGAELELRRVLAASGEDEALRQRWRRYHLASAALHGQLAQPEVDLTARIAAAIEAEDKAAGTAAAGQRKGAGVLRFAVAASVTFAVLMGARFYGAQDAAVQQGLASQQPAAPVLHVPVRPAGELQAPAVLASFGSNAGVQAGALEGQPSLVIDEHGKVLQKVPVEELTSQPARQ